MSQPARPGPANRQRNSRLLRTVPIMTHSPRCNRGAVPTAFARQEESQYPHGLPPTSQWVSPLCTQAQKCRTTPPSASSQTYSTPFPRAARRAQLQRQRRVIYLMRHFCFGPLLLFLTPPCLNLNPPSPGPRGLRGGPPVRGHPRGVPPHGGGSAHPRVLVPLRPAHWCAPLAVLPPREAPRCRRPLPARDADRCLSSVRSRLPICRRIRWL